MDSNNLIFSSEIDAEIEEIAFDVLLNHLSDEDFDKVYVKNVCIAPNEIIFFSDIDGTESIIRIRV